MIIATPYSGQVIGVLGLGKSGIATVDALSAAGAKKVLMWDDTPASAALKAAQKANVKAVPPEQWMWDKISALAISPGIPLSNTTARMAQAQGVPVIGDIDILYNSCPLARYIGITGTNGKSTTTTLIGHILQHAGKAPQVGGNLGTAALSLSPLGEGGTYVLEMSSYQLDLVRDIRFSIAVHLNLSEDHLDRHGSMEGYLSAKRHIFDRQSGDDVAIVGVDDAWSESLARAMTVDNTHRVLPISGHQKVQHGVYVLDGILHNTLGDEVLTFDMRGIRSLQGAHNGQNAAAAYATCVVAGVEHAVICEAMQCFAGLAHRMQWLGEVRGVQYVNDSKATNADAAEKALMTYDPVYWIAGGVAKEGGIASLAPYFPRIRKAYLIGAAAHEFAQTLEGKVPFVMSQTMDAAFAEASADAERERVEGAAVVLAPACASFDQYKNFEERGEHFVRLFDALNNASLRGIR